MAILFNVAMYQRLSNRRRWHSLTQRVFPDGTSAKPKKNWGEAKLCSVADDALIHACPHGVERVPSFAIGSQGFSFQAAESTVVKSSTGKLPSPGGFSLHPHANTLTTAGRFAKWVMMVLRDSTPLHHPRPFLSARGTGRKRMWAARCFHLCGVRRVSNFSVQESPIPILVSPFENKRRKFSLVARLRSDSSLRWRRFGLSSF